MTKQVNSMEKKRVLVIGNGFDLDFGSDTRYCTYARVELSQLSENDSPLLRFLKKKYIELQDKNWFDFEKELAEYVSSIQGVPNEETIEKDRKDFQGLLSIGKFMDIVGWKTEKEQRTEYVNSHLNDKPELLSNPVQIWGRDESVANLLLNLIAKSPSYFSQIVTFNYTNLYQYLRVAIDELYCHDDIKTEDVLEKIHIIPIHIEPFGNNDKIGVLGIEDSLNVPAGYEFLKKSNQIEENKRRRVISLIFEAEELVIFGHSLGNSDSDYFKPLFMDMFSENPSHERKITFITKGNNSGIWEQIRKYTGQINIMPKKRCTDIHFVNTEAIESMLVFRDYYRRMEEYNVKDVL